MVKRVGNLMPLIADRENLREAFLRAAKDKRDRSAVVDFRNNLDHNIELMHTELSEGTYMMGGYHFFTIYEPKERKICAATFRDRVMFHAVMRVCQDMFERYQISDSYACRKGKGQYKALERARTLAAKYAWYAKIDMVHYFDSIEHKILLGQLARRFKDPRLLLLFRNLLDTYEADTDRGLPIGNLTSQFFANHYLAVADRYAKQVIHIKAFVRYMDDVIIFAHRKQELMDNMRAYTDFVHDRLKLNTHDAVVGRTEHGINFLGYVVCPNHMKLTRRSRDRYTKKMMELTRLVNCGYISQNEYAVRATCLTAFVSKAATAHLRNRLINKRALQLYGV